MAFTIQPDAAHIEAVREQLGELISRFHRASISKGAAELRESFESRVIVPDVARARGQWNGNIDSLLTGHLFWHHQVTSGGEAIGIAHSQLGDDGAWHLTNLFMTHRAKKFANAIEKIDRERPGNDVQVFLAKAPLHHVDFFILKSPKDSEAYLATSANPSPDLVEGNYYPIDDLLRVLAAAPQPRGMHERTASGILPP